MQKNKLYVIGGMSRVGKTLVALKMKEKHSCLEILSVDRFRPGGNDNQGWLNLVNHLKEGTFKSEVVIEGKAITPEGVRDLKLENFVLGNVVFVGFGRESHADAILAYAYKIKDWVFNEIQAGRYTEQTIRSWMTTGIPESEDLKKRAVNNKFGYFDITDFPTFEEYTEVVSDYLLS